MTGPSALTRFNTTLLMEWLEPQMTSGARLIPGRMPDMGRVVAITMRPGAGLTQDGLFDVPAFSVESRGGENNYADAEAIAIEIDDIIIKSPNNFYMGHVYVLGMGRVGGGPQPDTYIDINSRYVFTCLYYLEVSTGLE